MIEILFDQYQRYKKTQEIVNELRNQHEKFNILEVGANEHRNLEKFLPHDTITYLDIHLDEAFQNDPQYILGDATQMDLPDESYDFIIALDVFEHIPAERRKNFIDEINRVSKKGFILMGPFDTDGVEDAEKNVNAFFKGLVGNDHPWLVEHIENGLPNWDKTLTYLKEKGIQYTCAEHGSINVWENLMRYHFLSVYSNKVLSEVQVINQFYNERIYPRDTAGKCYRKIIVGTKNELKNIILAEKVKDNDLKELSIVEAQFYQKLCSAYTNNELIVLKDNHINNLEKIIEVKDMQIEELEQARQLKDDHINNIEANLKLKDDHISNIETNLKLKDDHINNIETNLRLKDDHIKNLEVSIKAKDDYVGQIENDLKLKDNHINNIEAVIKERETDINNMKVSLQEKDNHINNIEDLVKQNKEDLRLKDNHINNISAENSALITEIERLRSVNEEHEKELDSIYSTLMGRVLKKLVNRKR